MLARQCSPEVCWLSGLGLLSAFPQQNVHTLAIGVPWHSARGSNVSDKTAAFHCSPLSPSHVIAMQSGGRSLLLQAREVSCISLNEVKSSKRRKPFTSNLVEGALGTLEGIMEAAIVTIKDIISQTCI